MPRSVATIAREHVEAFLIDLQERGHKPATGSQRFRSLQQFFKWLKEEGELRESPMANMRPPHVPEAPPPVLREPELRRLLAACEGTGFEERRDTAMIRLFHDTGMRRGELSAPASRMWTSITTQRSCSARAAARVPARSGGRRLRLSIASVGRSGVARPPFKSNCDYNRCRLSACGSCTWWLR